MPAIVDMVPLVLLAMSHRCHVPVLQGSRELNLVDMPYGFFHEPLPRRPAGYPVLLDTWLSAKRAEEVGVHGGGGGHQCMRAAACIGVCAKVAAWHMPALQDTFSDSYALQHCSWTPCAPTLSLP